MSKEADIKCNRAGEVQGDRRVTLTAGGFGSAAAATSVESRDIRRTYAPDAHSTWSGVKDGESERERERKTWQSKS